ncbi:MAG: OmpH family outer membrane protein [Segetibacter sp.]|jgi:outer membrane protein|nr:OmpH family outer membrane protein [Segetibacter sp.]
MKSPLLALNIILLILVGVLFYLHFSSSKKTEIKSAATTDANIAGPFKIAYFEMDSIENNYEYLKDVRNELKGKEQGLTTQLNQMKNRYMNKVNKFQQEGQTMTQERQGTIQQDLLQEQKMIQNKEQAMGHDLQDASFKKMQEVNKTIEDFLKEFNKDKMYSYILAYQPGTIYYKDQRFDITPAVLQGLNNSYRKKK